MALSSYDGGLTNDGAIFTVNKDGTGYRILHHFAGYALGDSQGPNGGLVEGRDGGLYGTLYGNGPGDVFRIRKDGSGYRLLHTFKRNDVDGTEPNGGLVAGSDGRLYGTTSNGGVGSNGGGLGTVFGISIDGTSYTQLHAFDASGAQGIEPKAQLVEGTDGALYGTTYSGGTYGFDEGGTVFRLNKNGSSFLVLHNFNGAGGEGCRPQAPMLEASDGMLYGTTTDGDGTYRRDGLQTQ